MSKCIHVRKQPDTDVYLQQQYSFLPRCRMCALIISGFLFTMPHPSLDERGDANIVIRMIQSQYDHRRRLVQEASPADCPNSPVPDECLQMMQSTTPGGSTTDSTICTCATKMVEDPCFGASLSSHMNTSTSSLADILKVGCRSRQAQPTISVPSPTFTPTTFSPALSPTFVPTTSSPASALSSDIESSSSSSSEQQGTFEPTPTQTFVLSFDEIPTPTPRATTAPVSNQEAGGQDTANYASILMIALIVIAVLLLGLAICAAYWFGTKRRRKSVSTSEIRDASNAYTGRTMNTSYHAGPRTPTSSYRTKSSNKTSFNNYERSAPPRTNVQQHPGIMAVRIQRDAIFFGPLLSRGGYGEVYKGTYKGETVAIKQLLPERRKDMNQIDQFMTEVKLMSSLEHERIVRFIGVAWNSLSDVCVVVEYMENGDLRSVLSRWETEEERRPNGFDADKAKIALHIAHALTYLHSLQPVVVHRDLKSKNILLDNNLDAKLTDYGISRERAEITMTPNVGTSLWMAPEVLMGERYDEKADVFSFGVVLSELDTHKLPYAQAKASLNIPDAAILHKVSQGLLAVEFTEMANPSIVQLSRDCVSREPKERPTAAEVLYRVSQLNHQ